MPLAQRVGNLHAFARLYGVVRWFHPSDAAAAADWDRLAIDGVRKTIDAPDRVTLEAMLRDIFAPIAPTLHLLRDQRTSTPVSTSASASEPHFVAWQHLGFGDSLVHSGYQSKRTNRPLLALAPGVPAAVVSQSVDAVGIRGAQVRLRGKAKTAHHGLGQLWLRVDRPNGDGFFDNMIDRPAREPAWTDLEIVGNVATDATRVVFGILKTDPGVTWFDDLRLEVRVGDEAWKQIPVIDPGFEAPDPLAAWHVGVGRITSLQGWKIARDLTQAVSGQASLRVEPDRITVTDELFGDTPAPREVYEVDLGQGLRAQVPISLSTTEAARSAPRVEEPQITSEPWSTSFDPIAGVADVIVAWNALQHFWPYWDLVSVDWIAELDTSLARAVSDRDDDAHERTLELLSASLPDGHANVLCYRKPAPGAPPFATNLIEGRVIVTDTDASGLSIGDQLIDIDGKHVAELLDQQRRFVSGSAQWRTIQALRRLGLGTPGTNVMVRIRRGDDEQILHLPRQMTGEATLRRYIYPAIARLDDGVYYIDLARSRMSDIDAIMNNLAAAPGIVFDMRQRPIESRPLISHLLTKDVVATQLYIPRIIRPDHTPSSIAGWQSEPWSITAQQPHLGGRIAFITDSASVSLPESFLALVAYYHLGEIVGEPTAGTNGDSVRVAEPSGCTSSFTAMRVTNFDGSRFHLIGVQSTISATRTIAGVRAGRDELLEKALVYVRTGDK